MPRGSVFCNISIAGMRKASVLPVPVCAVASTSRPARAGGIALSCTGVGLINCAAVSRCCKAGESAISVNVVIRFVVSFQYCRLATRNGDMRFATWSGLVVADSRPPPASGRVRLEIVEVQCLWLAFFVILNDRLAGGYGVGVLFLFSFTLQFLLCFFRLFLLAGAFFQTLGKRWA